MIEKQNESIDIWRQPPENRGEALLQALVGFDDECVDLLESEQQDKPSVTFDKHSHSG